MFRHFGVTYCRHLQVDWIISTGKRMLNQFSYPKDEGSTSPRNMKDVGQKRAQSEDAIRSYSCSVGCITCQQYELSVHSNFRSASAINAHLLQLKDTKFQLATSFEIYAIILQVRFANQISNSGPTKEPLTVKHVKILKTSWANTWGCFVLAILNVLRC
jgi:hypothetical protein